MFWKKSTPIEADSKQYKVAILGFGGRGSYYARLCNDMPKSFLVCAIIDNNAEKLNVAKNRYELTDSQLFTSLEDFLKKPKVADYLFICTQDKEHIDHAIPALEAGYDLLLEKPIACSVADCLAIEKKANDLKRKVSVCHVLRYSVYYDKIKEVIESKVLGDIVAIDQVENVGYWHYAHSYVRGDWRDSKTSTPMILAKCCHDLDIAVYLAGSKCKKVTSVGKLNYFKAENAPKGATNYCVGGCTAKANCPYDAEKIYIDTIKKQPEKAYRNRWPQSRLMSDGIVTIPKLKEAIAKEHYGKCVFKCDNNVVDYQVTTMEFENNITSTLTMTAYSNEISRETRVRGTLGELVCDMTSNKIVLHKFGQKPVKVKMKGRLDSHGGGDAGMIKKLASSSLKTDISMSIESHIIGFAAEYSRTHNSEPIDLQSFRGKNKNN